MAIQIVSYAQGWESAVARFNQRMRQGHAPTAFDIPERAGRFNQTALVRAEYFLAVDEPGEVRGGLIILEHPAWLNGRRETVYNLQSPLSEGIIDPKYSMVAIQLIRFALKRCPYTYVVGMGSEENPLPRLLKASAWKVRLVPFFFRILNVEKCLSELRPLRRSAKLRASASLSAITGAGALGLGLLQRERVSTSGYSLESGSAANATDDAVWHSFQKRLSFAVERDTSTLSGYIAPRVERMRVIKGDVRGWYSVLVSPMKDHAYFGDLTVATLVDVVAAHAIDAGPIAALAVRHSRSAGCDLVVSNQMHQESQAALRAAGFLSYRSNYLLATSQALTQEMQDDLSFVTRQDGDGLVNLHTS